MNHPRKNNDARCIGWGSLVPTLSLSTGVRRLSLLRAVFNLNTWRSGTRYLRHVCRVWNKPLILYFPLSLPPEFQIRFQFLPILCVILPHLGNMGIVILAATSRPTLFAPKTAIRIETLWRLICFAFGTNHFVAARSFLRSALSRFVSCVHTLQRDANLSFCLL